MKRAVVAAILVLVAGTSAPPAAAVADREGNAELSYDVAHAISVRTSLAFDARLETVLAAERDAKAYPDTTWGIPLSVQEAAEVQRRLGLALQIGPAIDVASTDDLWAGWWIDHAAGGVPVILFKGNPEAKRSTIDSAAGKDATYRLESASHSMIELEEARDRVLNAKDELTRQGIDVVGAGIDPRLNAVAVTLGHPSDDAPRVLTELAMARVTVEVGEESSFDACPATQCMPPLAGGLGMTDQDGNAPCTAGYLARRHDISPAKLVIVTAGHCVEALDAGDGPWKHGNINQQPNDIGPNAQYNGNPVETFYNFSIADVGLANTSSVQDPWKVNKNRLLVNTNGLDVPVLEMVSGAQQTLGLLVCRMGRSTGLACGVIEKLNERRESPPHEIDHTVVYDADAIGGDSGGPIFQVIQLEVNGPKHARVFGTHVHSGGPPGQPEPEDRYNGWYSPWGRGVNALEDLGVDITPCTTSGCGL